MRATLGMKLQSEWLTSTRTAEFFKWQDSTQYQIGVVETPHDEGEDKVTTVVLNEREARALRHWLDAALGDKRY